MATSSFTERELKFDVRPDFVVPDLSDELGDVDRTEYESQEIVSEYFDTADYALLRAQMTLRRRTGTADTGWQLKVPQPPFREEVHAPLDGEAVPDDFLRILRGVTRDQPLQPVSTLVTRRSVLRLIDADGRELAEVDDDHVEAFLVSDSAPAREWHEIEVELVDGEDELLPEVGKQLRRSGARPAASSAKLTRALPDGLPGPANRPEQPSAGDVLAEYVAEQHRVILSGDVAIRRGNDGAVHKTRVASRRLRSTLRTFAPLFDDAQAAWLDEELRWYASLLGEVRDAQVLYRRLTSMIADLDDATRLGPVQARVDIDLRRDIAKSWATVGEQLTEERYLALLESLAGWAKTPPWTAKASRPAASLDRYVDRAERRVRRRLRRANRTGDSEALHATRKAAKRARYAAEATSATLGKKVAAKQAKRYRGLQDLLGEHQDSQISAAYLRRLGAKAGTTKGENGFAFGVLYEQERTRAADARQRARRRAKRYR
jgi:CHAD domain-containing protein